MKTINPVDAARVELLLADLRLPAIKLMWTKLAEQSDKEGWPAARFLAALAEHEIADRGRRRIERHLAEARLPVGKTFDSFDFEVVPMVSKAQVMALTSGDSWLEKGANLLLFGPPGAGKSHLAAAIGLALVEHGWRVLFMRTSDLVQRLQIARCECNCPCPGDGAHVWFSIAFAVCEHYCGAGSAASGRVGFGCRLASNRLAVMMRFATMLATNKRTGASTGVPETGASAISISRPSDRYLASGVEPPWPAMGS